MESGSGDISNFTNQTSPTSHRQSITSSFLYSYLPLQLLLCGIVLRVFYRKPSLRTISNLPIVNLIASDFMRAVVGILAITLFAVPPTTAPSTGDNVLCEVTLYTHYVQFTWSSWAIAIVAYGRSDVIVNVLNPKFTKKMFWAWTVSSWLASLITAMPPLVGWSSYSFKKDGNM